MRGQIPPTSSIPGLPHHLGAQRPPFPPGARPPLGPGGLRMPISEQQKTLLDELLEQVTILFEKIRTIYNLTTFY